MPVQAPSARELVVALTAVPPGKPLGVTRIDDCLVAYGFGYSRSKGVRAMVAEFLKSPIDDIFHVNEIAADAYGGAWVAVLIPRSYLLTPPQMWPGWCTMGGAPAEMTGELVKLAAKYGDRLKKDPGADPNQGPS